MLKSDRFFFLGGQNGLCEVRFCQKRPITAAAYHHLSDIILGGGLMKSFAGFRLLVMILWPDEVFAEVDATIFRQVSTGIGATAERQGAPFNGFKGLQPTPYYTPIALICQ